MKFIIPLKLPSLNTYTQANRMHWAKGAKTKSSIERDIMLCLSRQRPIPDEWYPIQMKITWQEKSKCRDVDNITSAKKFILDAMVKKKILKNDSQKYIPQPPTEVITHGTDYRIIVEIFPHDYKKCLKCSHNKMIWE